MTKTTDKDRKEDKADSTQFQYGTSLLEGDGIKAGFVTDVDKVDPSISTPMPLDKQILMLCKRRGYEYKGCINTSGGQGAIYRVFHPSLNVDYAVKLSYTDEEEARFISEAQILRQYAELNAKDICKLIDVQPRDGEIPPAIIMEFIDGVTLHKFRIESYPEFSEEDKKIASYRMLLSFVRIANDLALGHRNGIWHRDIKPANIIVTNPNNPQKIGFKVVDLGIAKNPNKQLTIPASVFGTPVYMSPEQINPRNGSVDNATDIFAMGLVLFFIVTGEEFYDGILDFSLDMMPRFFAIYDIMREVDKDGELVTSREDRLGIIEDEEMVAIIRNATVFTKENRYHTMDLMISPLCIQLNKLQKMNEFPVTKTYYDFFDRQSSLIDELSRSIEIGQEFADSEEHVKTTTPIPVSEEEDLVSDETPAPISTRSKRGFPWAWVIVVLLLLGFGGYFGAKYLTWTKRHQNHKIANKDVTKKDVPAVAKKVVVMKPSSVKVITKPAIKIVAGKPISVKKPVLNFETFRKKCETEHMLNSLRVKCMRDELDKIQDLKKRYLTYVTSWTHFCLNQKVHKKSHCIAFENDLAKVSVKVADMIFAVLKKQCLKETGKEKFYLENPSALLSCCRGRVRGIKNVELRTSTGIRLHSRFCTMGARYKRASKVECGHALQFKIKLRELRWKHRRKRK